MKLLTLLPFGLLLALSGPVAAKTATNPNLEFSSKIQCSPNGCDLICTKQTGEQYIRLKAIDFGTLYGYKSGVIRYDVKMNNLDVVNVMIPPGTETCTLNNLR